MANNTTFTSLDFDAVKNNLKAHLKSQTKFRDYDFEGSNMSVLLDILAYNTYLNNHYNNMAISEMFLDTASLDNSLASHAKELGYTPKSKTSARAVVDVTLTVTGPKPSYVSIPAKTKFNARCGNKTFTFTNQKTMTAFPVGNVYQATDVEIHEGEWKTELHVVTEDSKKFEISDTDVDISSVEVIVRNNSDNDSPRGNYRYVSNIFGVGKTDPVFFIEPSLDTKYAVLFGSNKFGKQPTAGNVVEIRYRKTKGSEANGIEVFTPASTIGGYSAICTTKTKSVGGSARESADSIKFHAPKSVQIQDRAITESDYSILLKENFPEIESVSVYGGERADPPKYGRVVVAVDIKGTTGVTNTLKGRYQTFLKERAALAIEPIVESPQFMFVDVKTIASYDTTKSTKSESDVRNAITTAIQKFNIANLNNFNKNLRFSKFLEAIDEADAYIIGNDTVVRPFVEITPKPNNIETVNVHFRNALVTPVALKDDTKLEKYKPAIESSGFLYGPNDTLCYFQDDGIGNIHIIQKTTTGFVYADKSIGTIDYETGKLTIRRLAIKSAIGGIVKIFANTRSNDIVGPIERMISIRPIDVSVTVKSVTQ